ncbi:MAG TPA: exodeoxyribonuclease VII large subunit [Gammaproteobacteria bacterium]|jgi:exodeoxyribonuclease VII large subunit|nr:exodeoxyribonuclease VII large subunit [Gammaproteobacteria bacterium]
MNVEQTKIYSVSRLNNEARLLLESTFINIWVEGEISNFAAPHSGHWYFSLKDASAQVRCAMFKGSQRKLGFTPKDGLHVLIKARVSLYENRGEFQLIAETMEERGEGRLQQAFIALKKKLEAAGLFNPAIKKPLPIYPKQIGVITSATGAAIRDILTVLQRRYACVPVIIYPTLVQGETAAPNIVRAIQIANQRQECDVLILARGGGSLEDLWPFNEESVAQAIYQSQLPIISGVGHEVDFTIADFVADVRAPTPSAAAELCTPDVAELISLLGRYKQQLLRRLQHKLERLKQQLEWVQKHLQQQHPKRRLLEKMQRLDFCELTLVRLMESKLHQYRTLLATCVAKLDAFSPLATLKRGYAIVTKEQRIISDVAEVNVGDKVQVRLSKGEMDCVVL